MLPCSVLVVGCWGFGFVFLGLGASREWCRGELVGGAYSLCLFRVRSGKVGLGAWASAAGKVARDLVKFVCGEFASAL